jgi:hypothetical protein
MKTTDYSVRRWGPCPPSRDPSRAAKGAGMIDEDGLISLAEKELSIPLTERQKAGLIILHEWYFKRLKEKPHITAPELREKCNAVLGASEKFLTAIKKPLPYPGSELIHHELVDWVKAYQGFAQKLLEHFEPSTMEKRWAEEGRRYRGPQGKRENWPLHMYVRELSQWYEDVTGKRASGAVRAVFVRLLHSCFTHIEPDPDKEPSRDFIKKALERMRGA